MPPSDEIERAGRFAWPRAALAGVDEVGRGPLAGPVVAAAVVLDPYAVPDGLNDSKALSAARREELSGAIVRAARAVAIASVPAPEIDAVNIRVASLLAMRRAVLGLAVAPERVLVDGRDAVPGLHLPCDAVVGGDARSRSIAAASIVAKVMRDAMMARAGLAWPQFGFERHKGYPVPTHRAALDRDGPCPLHRLTFGSVRRAVDGNTARRP